MTVSTYATSDGVMDPLDRVGQSRNEELGKRS